MIDIFTDLYKKVLGFFQTQEKENTKDVGYNRLKLVLMQDRTNLTPFLLERMRGEMIEVLSKYVEMDKEALELSFEQEGESMALMLSIPVLRAKEEEEIQAIIKAEEEAKAKAEALKEEESEETDNETSQEDDTEVEESDEELCEDVNDDSCDEVCACVCDENAECSGETEEQQEEISEKKSKKKK